MLAVGTPPLYASPPQPVIAAVPPGADTATSPPIVEAPAKGEHADEPTLGDVYT